jgi:hypothetical protein
MQLATLTISTFVLVSIIHLTWPQPRSAAAEPGPEHQQLAMLAGEWEFEGEAEDSALGPGGKFSGKSSARVVSSGFFMEVRWTVKSPFGVLEGTEMRAYDAASRNHRSYWFMSDGSRIDGTETFTRDGFSSQMVLTDGQGRKVHLKARWDFAPDRSAFTSRWDVSSNGGETWSLLRKYSARRTDKPIAPRP